MNKIIEWLKSWHPESDVGKMLKEESLKWTNIAASYDAHDIRATMFGHVGFHSIYSIKGLAYQKSQQDEDDWKEWDRKKREFKDAPQA